MDDFPEHMFSVASWSQMGGVTRASWDFNGESVANAGNIDGGSGPQKSFTASLLPSGVLGSSPASQCLGSQPIAIKDTVNYPVEDNVHHFFDDNLMTSRLLYQRGLQDSLAGLPGASTSQAAVGSSRGLAPSPSVGSSGNEGSGSQPLPFDVQSPSAAAPTWCQPFMGGALPRRIGAGAKAETILQQEATSNDVLLIGKRPQNEDEANLNMKSVALLQARGGGPQDGLFTNIGGTQGSQAQTNGMACQQSHQEAGQGASLSEYGSHTGLSQHGAGTARPRVRARRGQATDPHSIAERLRRERIAERMKALQELVPNSNKADKTSVLDEIIEYVKFLQLQVKVLSMSRLGGAGAVVPLVSDLPVEGLLAAGLGRSSGASSSSQDGMAVIERQVAWLLEDNMGSAMQYLQGKGMCLMPLSIASTISCSNSRPQTNNQGEVQSLASPGDCRIDVSGAPPAASKSTSVAFGALVSSPKSSGGVRSDSTTKDHN